MILVIVGSSGVAFAAHGSGVTECQDAPSSTGQRCPDYGVLWTSHPTAPTAIPSDSNVKCTISIDSNSDTLIETAHNLAPGQSCTFSATLVNTEEQTVTITESLTTLQTSFCKLFDYADNVPHSPPNSIRSGHYFAYQGTLSLSRSAGNACEGAFATFHVLISATPSAKCSR